MQAASVSAQTKLLFILTLLEAGEFFFHSGSNMRLGFRRVEPEDLKLRDLLRRGCSWN